MRYRITIQTNTEDDGKSITVRSGDRVGVVLAEATMAHEELLEPGGAVGALADALNHIGEWLADEKKPEDVELIKSAAEHRERRMERRWKRMERMRLISEDDAAGSAGDLGGAAP